MLTQKLGIIRVKALQNKPNQTWIAPRKTQKNEHSSVIIFKIQGLTPTLAGLSSYSVFGQSSWAQINVCVLFFPSFLSLLYLCPWKSYTDLCQSTTCLSQSAYGGSCVFEKPIQKQRCSCNSATQWYSYAMLSEHQICQVSILLAAQFLQWWLQEAEQPEPADILMLKISMW